MTFDHESHHRRSVRMKGYDYTGPGAYYVTVCTQERECLFGEVINREMTLNSAGRMVETVWHGLRKRFPFVILDTFMVMPNHIHGILVLSGNNQGEHKVRPYGDIGCDKCTACPCGTATDSVGRIIQAFKSLTTHAYIRGARENGWPPFHGKLWQRNYYEHIIRDEEELNRVRKYILDNPVKWDRDRNNPASGRT